LQLQPGSYLLQLQTGNSVTHQYSPARLLTIEIEPPFWKKWWFYCSELAVALLSAYGIGTLLHRRKLKKALAEIALQQTIQQERERISRELHDNLGAQATALNAGLRNLQHNAAIAPELLRDVSETGANIMQNLRESIWALNNQQISLQNLSDRYKVFAKNILKNFHEIKLIYSENIDENFMMMPVAALNLLRIMQEALHNTLKHAAASEITVQIECGERFSIQYRDNGKGFNTTRYADPKCNGLHNIQARAEEAGLKVIIDSQPGNGTLITITQKNATQP
jgi:signal transduction histidine kinase